MSLERRSITTIEPIHTSKSIPYTPLEAEIVGLFSESFSCDLDSIRAFFSREGKSYGTVNMAIHNINKKMVASSGEKITRIKGTSEYIIVRADLQQEAKKIENPPESLFHLHTSTMKAMRESREVPREQEPNSLSNEARELIARLGSNHLDAMRRIQEARERNVIVKHENMQEAQACEVQES